MDNEFAKEILEALRSITKALRESREVSGFATVPYRSIEEIQKAADKIEQRILLNEAVAGYVNHEDDNVQ